MGLRLGYRGMKKGVERKRWGTDSKMTYGGYRLERILIFAECKISHWSVHIRWQGRLLYNRAMSITQIASKGIRVETCYSYLSRHSIYRAKCFLNWTFIIGYHLYPTFSREESKLRKSLIQYASGL